MESRKQWRLNEGARHAMFFLAMRAVFEGVLRIA
jgi:hypothetical protein